MQVRAAIELDILPLITLAKTYADEAGRWAGLKFDPDRAVYYGALAMEDPNQQIFICYEGKEIYGFMWVGLTSPVWTSDTIMYDLFLYVHPEHRNLAVATALVTESEKWAKVCGAKAVHTGANSGVFKDNAASALYQHLGYQPGGFNFYKDI